MKFRSQLKDLFNQIADSAAALATRAGWTPRLPPIPKDIPLGVPTALPLSGAVPDRPFYAVIRSIHATCNNGVKAHEITMTADGVDFLIKARIVDSMQRGAGVQAADLKSGDVIKTSARGAYIFIAIPVVVLGPVEKCPPGQSRKNESPVYLAYIYAPAPPAASAPTGNSPLPPGPV